jgi:hypothetical protein
MPDGIRDRWTREMWDHERELAQLSIDLAQLQGARDPASRPVPAPCLQVAFLNAQLTKHRIGLALAASRLAAPSPLVQ